MIKNVIGTIFSVLTATILYAQGVSISPSRIFFSAKSGETMQEKLLISNSSNKEYFFQISLKDWKRDSLGRKLFSEPGTSPTSNARWVEMEEGNIVRIGPNQKKEVRVSLKHPDSLQQPRFSNSMLFFTQFTPQSDTLQEVGKMGVRVLFEFGIHLYHTPISAGPPDIAFMEFQDAGLVESTQGKMRQIRLKVKNSGERVSDANIKLELTNKTDGQETLLEPIGVSLMPGEEQWVSFFAPVSLKGNYLGASIAEVIGTSRKRIAEKDLIFE